MERERKREKEEKKKRESPLLRTLDDIHHGWIWRRKEKSWLGTWPSCSIHLTKGDKPAEWIWKKRWGHGNWRPAFRKEGGKKRHCQHNENASFRLASSGGLSLSRRYKLSFKRRKQSKGKKIDTLCWTFTTTQSSRASERTEREPPGRQTTYLFSSCKFIW